MDIIVGIPACFIEVNGHPRHDTPARYAEAVLGGAGAVPILIPPLGEAELAVLDRIDGLLLPGSPSNVHPHQYDGGDSRTPELHDPARDATTLPLIRAAIARGMPVLAICRGIQELNVALGGTLHQQVHELDGHMRHDTPARYAEAVLGGAGAVPILIPPLGEAELAVLERIDGLLTDGTPRGMALLMCAGSLASVIAERFRPRH